MTMNRITAEEWLKKGSELHSQMKYEEASAAYKQAFQSDPCFSQIWTKRAGILFILRQYDEVIAMCETIISTCVLGLDFAVSLKASALHEQGRNQEAYRVLEKRVIREPAFKTTFLFSKAIILASLSRFDEALSMYDQLIRIEEKNEYLRRKAEVLRRIKRYDEARLLLQNTLAEDPANNPEDRAERLLVFYDLIDLLIEKGSVPEALQICDNEIRIDAVKGWNKKGEIFQEIGKTEEALAAYTKALSIYPQNIIAMLTLGDLLAKTGRQKDAEFEYLKALSVFKKGMPKDPELLSRPDLAAEPFYRLNLLNESLQLIEMALLLQPFNFRLLKKKGDILKKLGRDTDAYAAYSKAISESDRMCESTPDSETAWLQKAEVLACVGRYEEAFTASDQAYSIKPRKKTRELREQLAAAIQPGVLEEQDQ